MTGRPRLNAFDWQSPAGVTDLTKIISPVDDDGDQLSRRDNAANKVATLKMGPQTIVIDLVRKIQLVLRRVCDADLHPHGLSFSQFAVLRAVAEHPGGSLSALARSSGMSKQAVHQMLGGLRAASLVTAAERDQGLGRSVELAPAGRLVLQAATQVMDEAEERMLAGIAVHDRDQLVMLLRRCVENLETTPPRHPPEQPNPSRAAGEPGVDNNGLRMPNPRPAEKPSIS